MKPNFALNLSHEGISLLHRAKTGWLRVGDVALDAPDLNVQLQLLRQNAADLENGGLTTKLVIPNSQILYTELDAPGPDTASRISQIRDGLVGLTPYDVSDLVFDWRLDGKRVNVAVVARDTLREAENFATEYRFNPVSFVAVPINGAFEGEPFFGPSRHAASLLSDDETIEPDKQRIKILGQMKAAVVPLPEPDVEPVQDASTLGQSAAVETAPEPQITKSASASETPSPANKPDVTPIAEPVAKNESLTEPAAQPKDTTAPTPDASGDVAPAFLTTSKASEDTTPTVADTLPAATFSHRGTGHSSNTAPATPRTEPIRSQPRISFGLKREIDDTTPAAVTAASLTLPTTGNATDARPDGVADLYPSPKPKITVTPAKEPLTPDAKTASTGPDRTPMAMTAPHTADVLDPKEKAAENRKLARQKAVLAGSAVGAGIVKPGSGRADTQQKPVNAKPTKSSEAAAMTVFGARGRVQQRGKPKYLGLMLTSVLLVALVVLALWSTYFMNDVTRGLFGTIDEEPGLAAPAVIPQPSPLAPAPAPIESASAPSQTLDPVVALPSEPPQSPIEAAIENILAEPQAPAPLTREVPEPDPEPAVEDPVEVALAEPETPITEPEVDLAPEPEPEPEPETAALPDPVISVPERQDPPTPAEAEARYAATGIWQLDPEPLADVPGGGDQLEDIYVASIDPVISSVDAFALPGANSLDTDNRPPALNAPAPLGTVFDFDDRGLVRATPDGALTPDGVPVFSGTPAIVPGPRPADLKVPVDETQLLLDERLRNLRPTLRPGDLSEANERARLGGFSNTELAAKRPTLRPATLVVATRPSSFDADKPETEIASVEPDQIIIGDNVTKLAVAVSRAPPVRPSNFAGLVQRALAEAAQSPPPPLPKANPKPEIRTAAVAPPRVPSVPSRASVARQATVKNAINLGKVNLIGIYGSSSKRRALVRLSSGKYVKVEVGDRVDGGRVSAIGDNELRYIKSGRNITLKMPKT